MNRLHTNGATAIVPRMPENAPPHSDAEYYGFFMTSLFGLLDDAQLTGYSPAGTEMLRQAQNLFWEEFKSRHPDAWTEQTPLPDRE